MTAICPHGMPSPASCFECMEDGNLPAPPAPEALAVRGRPFTARFDGHCTGCNTAMTASDDRPSLIVPLRRNSRALAVHEPVPTVCASGGHHGLLMRNNAGGAEMVTPLDQPARTMTTKGHQSLLLPYYGTGQARPVDQPLGTQPTRDRWALVDVESLIDDCGFRMLEPHEIAAAMAFPAGYIPAGYTKRDRVKLAGNAVTPPVMAWITGRILQALEAAA